jgi:hypothetical protein
MNYRTTITDILFSYNPEFGGNVRFVTSRYWEIGFNYSMFSLGGHARWEEFSIENADPIKGNYIGFTARKYRVKKGGLAPIGKYIEFGLQRMSAKLDYITVNEPSLDDKATAQQLSASVALGAQNIFWGCVVANAGVRVGVPIYVLGSTHTNSMNEQSEKYMTTRLLYHRVFTPFFGIGVIL